MLETKGTKGYSSVIQKFIKASKSISFEVLHKDFLEFLPTKNSLILDIGAGIGRDAYELAIREYKVIAVEPLKEFRSEGQKNYTSNNLTWIDDSLPKLNQLDKYLNKFDFILASGIWHHLDRQEQKEAISRISKLLKPEGIFALSLRNGPSGAGTHTFPTNVKYTIEHAKPCNLIPLLILENQPSLLKNKENVKWSRIAFKKIKL